jgi:hypothetical protein
MLAEPQDTAIQVATRDPGVHDVQSFGERLHIRVARGGAGAAASRLAAACSLAGVRVSSLRAVPSSLEDVFIDRVVTTRAPGAA